MASSAANPHGPREIIDLVSDDSDAESDVMEPRRLDGPGHIHEDEDLLALFTPPPLSPRANMLQGELNHRLLQNEQAQAGYYIEIDGQNIFIPDEPEEAVRHGFGPPPANANTVRDLEIAMGLQQPEEPVEGFPAAGEARDQNVSQDRELAMALENQTVNADTCLQRVLEIFPDISHEHVLKMYNDFGQEDDYETLPGQARLDNIIEQLVSAPSYPKQEKGKLKRKRQPSIDEDDMKKWERQDRIRVPNALIGPMRSMLKAEFPNIPVQYIQDILKGHQHFYQAYVILAKTEDNADGSARPYGKGRPSSNLANADTMAMNCGWPELVEELNAARLKVQSIRAERAVEDAKRRAEKENLEKAIAAGETSECSACFDDLPMNRQIHCNGPVAHFTCYDCALTYIKTEVGESRCRVLCTAGCGACFANDQLNQLSDNQLLAKLAQLQQEKDIRDAGLDDLEECPFCDYKAILPPIEEDFEFRCANPECEKISCRRCKSVSHIPISCEQHAKDNKINSRHKIEEAMTAALIRSCNKCKKTFIKEYGCNKMRCPSCGNMQCYVCSVSLRDYNHFDQSPSGTAQGGPAKGKCPLYDNVEERHEREVKEAEAAARAQVVSENPDVSVEDLEIKVSDAVKKATQDRIRQGGGPPGVAAFGGFPDAVVEPFHGFHAIGRQQAAADRARQQAARRAVQNAQNQAMQARLRAQNDEVNQMRRVIEAQQQQQQQQQQGGLFGPVQGYIPFLFNPPAQAPAPQAQQGLAAAAAAPAQPQRQPQDNGFAIFPRLNLNYPNPFGGRGLGNDGAADYIPAQQNPALANNVNNNNNNNNAGIPRPFQYYNPPAPAAWPNPQQRNAAAEDWQQQMRLLELQNLTRVHDQRLLQRQALGGGVNPRPANPHYQGYEEEMRRMGFPPPR